MWGGVPPTLRRGSDLAEGCCHRMRVPRVGDGAVRDAREGLRMCGGYACMGCVGDARVCRGRNFQVPIKNENGRGPWIYTLSA